MRRAKYTLLTALCLFILPAAAFCQNSLLPRWFDDAGTAAGSATPNAVKVDAANNVYVVGSFKGTVDFDPAPATATNLVTPPGSTSGFIAKYNSDGSLAWAHTFDGTDVSPTALTLGSDGSISVIGKFSGTMDADPGNGMHGLNSAGGYDAFVVHLDGNGVYLWANGIGGQGEESGNAIATDANGNIYTVQQFQSTINIRGNNYTAMGTTDGMLVKYAPDGSIVFTIDLGYAGLDNSISDIAVDKAGNVDIIGYLNGPVNFNPLGTIFISSAQKALFVAQYSPDGILNWVNNIQGNFVFNAPGNSFKIALDGANSVYVTSPFSQTMQFKLGVTLTAKGATDVFVARYGEAGSLSVFKEFGGVAVSIVQSSAIAISPDDKFFYLTGNFQKTVDFSTIVGAPSPLTYHGNTDLFLAKYGTLDFGLVTVTGAGNAACSNVAANGIAATGSNDVILAGTFCSVTDFGGSVCPAFNITAKSTDHDMLLADYTLQTPITNNIVSNPANCGGGANKLIGSVPQGGVGTYTYEWQSSTDGTNFTEIPGADSINYQPPAASGIVYYLRKVFSGACGQFSLSNPVSIDPAVQGIKNNVISTVESTDGCGSVGANLISGTEPVGGGGVYNYQWQSSTNNIDWSNIRSSPSNTSPTEQDLKNYGNSVSVWVRRLVMIPGCATPSISNEIKLTVYPVLDNILLRATGETTFCGSGNPGTLMGIALKPTGGDGVNYTYQWMSATTKPGDYFKPIPGATSADYVPGVLTTTTLFKREVRSGPCYTGDPGRNSNPIVIAVKTLFNITNNTIAQATPDGTLCRTNADPSMITGQLPGGGSSGGSFFYQWQQSGDNIHFVDITGATDKDYDPPKITQTTYYRRVATYSADTTCMTPSPSSSLAIKVSTANVSNNTISQLVPDPAVICSIPAKPKKITGSDAVGSGFTYQWQNSVDGINFTDITGATGRDYDPAEISQTMSYRRAAIVADACIAPVYSDTLTINVATTASNNYITAPADTVFCDQGDAGPIKGSTVTGGSGVRYQWQSSANGAGYTDIGGSNANYPDFDPPASNATVFYRRMVTTNVCNVPSATKAVAIRVYHTPTVSVQDSVVVCVGDKTMLKASGGRSYKWSPADGLSATNIASPMASPTKTTTYTVEVSDSGHCAVNAMVKVIVVPKPTADAGADVRMYKGEQVQLAGKVTGNNVQYSWSPSEYLSNPNSLNPIARPIETTTYRLTAITNQGCSIVTDDVTVSVFEKVVIPNSFTPNGDGTNDTWEIAGLPTYAKGVLNIFNRNGVAIFRSVGYSKPWDGFLNGKALPFGTYYYTIDLHDGSKPLSGWVALIK